MNLTLIYVHLGTIAPAFFLGTYLMAARKGDSRHRLLGKIYMTLMLFTAGVSLFIEASVGPQFGGHFGLIHLLSLLTIATVPYAYIAAKNHDVLAHKYSMTFLYIGGLLIAGGFTLVPGRLMHGWLFS